MQITSALLSRSLSNLNNLHFGTPHAQRSAAHYYDSEFIVIQVQNQLYHLPIDLPKRCSPIFADLFSLPHTGICSDKGLTDNTPIMLHGHSSMDFDCLLNHLFGKLQDTDSKSDTEQVDNTPPESMSTLVSLLTMSTIFDVSVGKSYAINQLEAHPDLDLPMKLQLCHQFKILLWLTPTFRELVLLPIESLRPTGLAKIPAYILHALIQVKHQISTHWLTLVAVVPPAMAGMLCHTPSTCANGWETGWKAGPAEMLRHLDVFYSGWDILAQLDLVEIPQVFSDCWESSVANVKETGCLLMEDGLVEDKLEGLRLPMQQFLELPPELDSIEIGDYIEVLDGKHVGKRSVVNWYAKGSTNLWFLDALTEHTRETSSGLSSISVPVAMVRQTSLTHTIQHTKDKGFDLHVPIKFVTKICNAFLDSFRNDIGWEVFIIGGDRKGYQATLHSLSSETCIVAVCGQQCTEIKLHEAATRYGMRLNGPSSSPSNAWSTWSEMSDADKAYNPTSTTNSTSLTYDPWAVDNQDAEAEKLPYSGPIPWLMSKEFALTLSTYHILLKVSPSFLHGRLHKQFVLMACPDLFCGENGPAPEGHVAAFCTSNGTGAAIEHHHIPASDLSLAPPRKKNQQCLILGGAHCGALGTVVNCWTKKKTVDLRIGKTVI
ncbi:hypothetical protein F4604DRAFT_1681616 [Suillus subluteus]|nr:hypothetical protein F4604DRAFT_1681616 [Suillus subluteus]